MLCYSKLKNVFIYGTIACLGGYIILLYWIPIVSEIYNKDSSVSKVNLCPYGYSDTTEDLLCKKRIRFDTKIKNPCWVDKDEKLKCLPYFMIVGMPKCGTTDMFQSIISHPEVVSPVDQNGRPAKELDFFDIAHYGIYLREGVDLTSRPRHSMQFRDYINYFRKTAEAISHQGRQFITGEATPGYLRRLFTWTFHPQNKNKTHPIVLLPDIIKHLLPNVKLIITLRDPVERARSAFHYHYHPIDKDTAQTNFNDAVYSGVQNVKRCIDERSVTGCVLRRDLYMSKSFGEKLLTGLYQYFIQEWMKVFPEDQVLIIPFEEYKENKIDTLNKIFSFLKINNLSTTEMDHHDIIKSKIKNKGPLSTDRPIDETTRDFMYRFYEPYNEKLYRYLGNKFTHRWTKKPYDVYLNHNVKKTTRL